MPEKGPWGYPPQVRTLTRDVAELRLRIRGQTEAALADSLLETWSHKTEFPDLDVAERKLRADAVALMRARTMSLRRRQGACASPSAGTPDRAAEPARLDLGAAAPSPGGEDTPATMASPRAGDDHDDEKDEGDDEDGGVPRARPCLMHRSTNAGVQVPAPKAAKAVRRGTPAAPPTRSGPARATRARAAQRRRGSGVSRSLLALF